MTFSFHPEADEEFREAIGYYETCQRRKSALVRLPCYNWGMLKRSLLDTNVYLRDPGIRREMFTRTVCTSTAIEGVRLTPADLEKSAPTPPRPTLARESGSSSRSRR